MSNNNLTYQNTDSFSNGYTYNDNPIYRDTIKRDTIKRDTIYEDVKINKPIVLPPKKFGDYTQNNNYNNNLYSEYPVSNNNDIRNNNYLNPPTIELATENNLENYFNGAYGNKVINITQNNNNNFNNTYSYENGNNNIVSEYNEYSSTQVVKNENDYNPPIIAKTPLRNIKPKINQVLPPKTVEFTKIKKLPERNEANNINISPQIINTNYLEIATNPIKQIVIKENEIAKVKKIIEENGENTNEIKKIVKVENEPVIVPKTNENIKKEEVKNFPGPAKISKISSKYFPYNPKVRFAKQEKINIVKLQDDNINNNNIQQKINNTAEIIKSPLIKKEENIKNGLNNENILNQPKIKKINEDNNNQKPNDDYETFNKRNKYGFHNVKTTKKNQASEFFPHQKLLDIKDYNDFFKEESIMNQQKPKVNITILNNKRNFIQEKKNLNPFIPIKKIEKKENFKNKEFIRTFPDEVNMGFNNDFNNDFDNNQNNKRYYTKNEEEENEEEKEQKEEKEEEDIYSNFDKHNSDIVDDNFELEDEDVKNSDDMKNKKINEDNRIEEMNNNDELDEFDNNFNEHDKFYKKMKNIFDE